ncbi:beta-galactosidase [Amycolatopsis mediterranei S699]|uniref:Beta-galactosidase n=2 Tax=Amycolatopsis mediterranei TaxID=33910 RepID=A0A0H3DF33_AMYMU|nr:beta-galactosidase [Amycolatopsis mediterranei U32]AEK46513.1 beta-galactosidase [Amycolatopsis mediterranei S699]AGT88372.1 beta-galactosidase [Amycolatopsis mediterranei RB]KDO04932.1 beta-galactosidase [Amycolatopsis mediterranei]AFO81244.1 beta-galactosidase [Amycolatopsis mediterranei S699]
MVYDLNPDWRFVQADVPGANATTFDDSSWTTVSVPHTYNDVDSFDNWITSSGESAVAMQITWYRKHFTMPAGLAGMKVFLEFERVRQAATVYVNGVQVGLCEFGVSPFGFDITDRIRFGADNVIAVKADNTKWRPEQAGGVGFQWDTRDFYPEYGGLTHNVRMHVLPRTYFTLPLSMNLGTTGTYVFPSAFNIPGATAAITAQAQVRNEDSAARTVTVSANLIDAGGALHATIAGSAVSVAPGETRVVTLSQRIPGLRFWSPASPSLYTVEMVLSIDGAVVDAYPVVTGFRKTAFQGGTTAGGVYLNDQYVYLTGYAVRTTNEWAVIGGAVPEWLTGLDGQLIRDSHANLIRWMHVSAPPNQIRMTDKYGIVSVQPAGDKESDVTGRQWDQRVEQMRASMVYFRNSPSILFWEAGNNWITAAHMSQMLDLRRTWDPAGGRAIGCRAISDSSAYGGTAAVDAAEYVGTMLNRHYSVYARDRKPVIECEYTRDEAPRRVWDNYSPPDFGYRTGPDVTYHWTSEDFAATVAASSRYEFWSQRIQGPGDRRYAGAAALIWADSNQHGRQYNWECARLSGRVDAVRIPKESLHSYRVMQNPAADIHVIGHWTYPSGTRKTIHVLASAAVHEVRLLVNGTQVGSNSSPAYDFLYSFPDVAWQSGTITAVGYTTGGTEVVRASKTTTGAAVALKLTPYTAPGGLRADGSDVAFFDVEAVDSAGRRMPTHQARVDFTLTGPGTFLGGFNSHIPGSVHKSAVETEAGVNRVFVRATRGAGTLTLRATASGLTAATATVTSTAFTTTGGLTVLRS